MCCTFICTPPKKSDTMLSATPLVFGSVGMGSRAGSHSDGTRGVDVSTE